VLVFTHKYGCGTPSVWQASYGLRIPPNPKSETLNPKQSPKTKILMGPNPSMPPRNCGRIVVFGLGYSDLGLVSDFDIRNSDFHRSPTVSSREVVGHVQEPVGGVGLDFRTARGSCLRNPTVHLTRSRLLTILDGPRRVLLREPGANVPAFLRSLG
jgi:hypothetical protein